MKGSHQFSSTKPLNVDLRPFSLVPRNEPKRSQTGVLHEVRVWRCERLDTESKVPQWMFEDTIKMPFFVWGIKTSVAKSLWVWNVVALISHICLFIGTIIASRTSGAGSLNQPSLPMYVSHPHPYSPVHTSINH